MASATLSKNDSAVLGALFDPEASLQNNAYIDATSSFNIYDSQTQLSIQQQERDALLLINQESPSSSDIQAAISQLDELIRSHPEYASAYNNRAQARRILIDSSAVFSQRNQSALKAIMADLSQAISLASPQRPTDAVSQSQAQVIASAHTHRGYLIWRASRSEDAKLLVDAYSGVDKDQLEELASRDFAAGGRYGNKTAQTLAVKTNPYAKLCGSIVKEALRKEISDYYQDQTGVVAR